jgi:flagellar basal body-associated protein FliL
MSKRFQIALVVSMLALALAVAGLGAFLFLRPGTAAAPSAPAQTPVTVDAMVFFKTKNFVTNLADTDRPRFVDATVALALRDDVALENAKKIEPQVRDIVLGYLRLRTAADLAGAAGKEKLGTALQTGLNDVLKGQLIKVYITDLTVQ